MLCYDCSAVSVWVLRLTKKTHHHKVSPPLFDPYRAIREREEKRQGQQKEEWSGVVLCLWQFWCGCVCACNYFLVYSFQVSTNIGRGERRDESTCSGWKVSIPALSLRSGKTLIMF